MQQQRVRILRKILKKQKLDALLVTNFYNILYLTGFKTLTENEREAFVIVTQRNVYLITDGRYINNVKLQITNDPFDTTQGHPEQSQAQDCTWQSRTDDNSISNNKYLIIKLITSKKKLIQHLEEIIKDEKIKTLGVESEDLHLSEYQLLNKLKVQILSTSQLVVRLREIKKKPEIEKIKKACEIGDRCLGAIVKTIKVGDTEKEIAWKIEKWIREKNYEIAFEPIVAIDKSTSTPHYLTKAGNERVKHHSLILIDFGVKYKDYCSDMTRMIFVGKPEQEIINVYNKLLLAQEKTLKILRQAQDDRFPLNKVDEYCRKFLTSPYSLIPNTYPHSTGHGVGLEVHEYPKVSTHSNDLIKPGQVFTIEPGIYFEGKWGMRIEDTVAINDKLQVRVLTKCKKEIFI